MTRHEGPAADAAQHDRLRALEDENRLLRAALADRGGGYGLGESLDLVGEMAGVGVWQAYLRTGRLAWSREVYRICGVAAPVEPALDAWLALFDPATRQSLLGALQAAAGQGTRFDLELPFAIAPDRQRWVRIRGCSRSEGGGNLLVGTLQDITDDRRAEADIRRSRDINASVFDSLSEHVAVLDQDGVIIATNRAWRRFWTENGGQERAEAGIGINYLAVCANGFDGASQENARSAHDGICQVMAGERPTFAMEYPCDAPGRAGWFQLHVSPLLGSARGVVVSHSDITLRKVAEMQMRATLRELENQRFAMDQHAIIAVTDPRGRITHVNDKFCSISGYSREELIGQDHRLVNSGVHPKAFFIDLWRTIAAGRVWHGEVCNRAKTGSLYWVSTTIVPLMDAAGKPRAFIAIRTDITQRKEDEARLAQARDRAEQLNRELGERIAQANELALKAERASEVKSVFVANMSHEIRTPMNGIMGMIEVLLDTPLSAEQEDCVRTAYRSTEALMSIVNDVLDFSKLEADRVVLERMPFDLSELVHHVAKLFGSQLAGRPVELLVAIQPGTPRTAIGDPGRIRQVLMNLVGNAVKFTHRGHVRIDVSQVDGSFIIAVADTGIGIPARAMEHLFTPFTQVDTSHSRKYGGTGLGLVISRRFVELMNGTLAVASTEGQGSRFTVALPLDVPQVQPAEPAEGASFLRGLRVALIDSQDASAEVTTGLLAGLEAEVRRVPASDILRLLRSPEGRSFQAVAIDLHRGADGAAEAAQAIRREPALRWLPLIAFAGTGGPDEPARIEQLGFNACLAKPVTAEDLGSAVALAIASCRQADARLATQEDVRPTATPVDGASPIDAHVLLVEDHDVNARIATLVLRKLGARVTLAENGRAAVELVHTGSFDLVLMDCQMPVMDGYEATQAIRSWEKRTGAKRMPIIAMTANAMPGSRERCLSAGMDDYLAKPFKAAEVEALLRHWLCGAEPPLPTPTPAALRDLPLIDYTVLRDIERGDRGMAAIILGSFRDKLARDLELIAAGLAKGDLDVVRRSAHKIKGSSGSVGALALHKSASELEAAAVDADRERCQRHGEALRDCGNAFLSSVDDDALAIHLPLPTTPERPCAS